MSVRDLIEMLREISKGLPKGEDTPICYRRFSEQCILERGDIELKQLCLPREDGWVQNYRQDKEDETYVVFPGN